MCDFFISRAGPDSAWAVWVAWVLEANGYTTHLQDWDFRPGKSFIRNMHEGAVDCERTIAILSPDYFTSDFATMEWEAPVIKDPSGRDHALITVRVRECEPPGLLGRYSYIDLVGKPEEEAEQALLAGVRVWRAKPVTKPNYPGANTDGPAFPGPADDNDKPVAKRSEVAKSGVADPQQIPADAESWRRHTDRVKRWVQSVRGNLESNGIPNPGYLIDISGEGDASLFRQHFSGDLIQLVEEWNRAIVRCQTAFKLADTRAAVQINALELAHEMSGWPFRMMVIEHAGGMSVRVDTMQFEFVGDAVFDPATRDQVHPLRRLTEAEQQSLLATLNGLRHQTAEWPETLALGEAWRAVEILRSQLRGAFTWVDTLERLPGECDRCPDRVPLRR